MKALFILIPLFALSCKGSQKANNNESHDFSTFKQFTKYQTLADNTYSVKLSNIYIGDANNDPDNSIIYITTLYENISDKTQPIPEPWGLLIIGVDKVMRHYKTSENNISYYNYRKPKPEFVNPLTVFREIVAYKIPKNAAGTACFVPLYLSDNYFMLGDIGDLRNGMGAHINNLK